MVNYIEGSAFIDGRQVALKNAGSAELGQNQVLKTGQGKAEVLLTPGVFLRVSDNSELRMVSPGLTDTQVELLRGEAMVEATEIHKENSIRVLENGISTKLLKNGLYDFDAAGPSVRVYDGKAEVRGNDNTITLTKGKQAVLTGPLTAVKFDRNQKDDLYQWSSLRSKYLAEASVETARAYVIDPYGWYGPGWYWNRYFGFYSYLPGSFAYSPFGYGFYSPFRLYGPPVVIHRYPGWRPVPPAGQAGFPRTFHGGRVTRR
jgi:hypothetical protein